MEILISTAVQLLTGTYSHVMSGAENNRFSQTIRTIETRHMLWERAEVSVTGTLTSRGYGKWKLYKNPRAKISRTLIFSASGNFMRYTTGMGSMNIKKSEATWKPSRAHV